MNERASHQFLPFCINFRVRENNGTWGHWRRRDPAYWNEEQRDAEFAKLKNRYHIEYEKSTDMAELDGQLRAMDRLK